MKELEEGKRENLVFRLADESLAACERDANVAAEKLPSSCERFDYHLNELELTEFKRQLNEKSMGEIGNSGMNCLHHRWK
jgi:hypothetical protein